MESTDSPDVAVAKRLLNQTKRSGFAFQRTAPGAGAPLVGHRLSDDWIDPIHLEGFSRDCLAWRQQTSSLIVPADALVQRQMRAAHSMCFMRY